MKHTIKELCGETATIKEELIIECGNDVTIYAKDDKGVQRPIAAVEIWEGELRVIAWADDGRDDTSPTITPIRRLI